MSDDNNEVSISLAEGAYYTENYKICRQLLEFYFQNEPQRDQFYCRGKITFGLLINYESREASGTMNIAQKKKAISELLQALEIATAPNNQSRYKFIVYNLSVAFWEIVRPFLRSERAASFANEFNLVVNALEKQEENDLEWRILLLSAASLCADDEKNIKNATDYVDKAIGLLETLIQALAQEEQKLLKTLTDCKNEVDIAMNAFREIQEREELMKKPRKIDPDLPFDDPYYTQPIIYPPLQGLAAEGYEKVKEMLDEAQYRRGDVDIKMKDILHLKILRSEHLIRLHCQRVAVNPGDAKRYSTLPNVTNDFRQNYLVQIQCILSNIIPEKEWEMTFQQLLTNLEKLPESEKRNETILDIARIAWKIFCPTKPSSTSILPATIGVCRKFMEVVQTKITLPLSQRLRIKQDICDAYQKFSLIEENVTKATQKQPLTSNQIEGYCVSQRIDVIKLIERALTMAVASVEDKYLVMEIAAILWNVLYPLLTTNINRTKVHATIRAISSALESIDLTFSPVLKSFLYHELALCEALADYAGLALVEEEKAYLMDFGSTSSPTEEDKNLLDFTRLNDQYIRPFLKNLTLRVDVYGSPPDLHAQLILWLQQAKESTSKVFIKEMIHKSASLLFDEIDRDGSLIPSPLEGKHQEIPGESEEAATVDWSLLVMQKGSIKFDQVDLQKLSFLATEKTGVESSKFTYFLQERLQLLYSLATLAHSIQEISVLQKAASFILQLKWNASDVFASEFLDAQIHVCCLLSESFTSRILSIKARMDQFYDEDEEETASQQFSLGIIMEEIKDAEQNHEDAKDFEDILTMKKLTIQFLWKAYQLAMQRKDIYSIHNVLIYFWNLHVHIMKGCTNSSSSKELLTNILPEFGEFTKFIIQSLETVISFPYTHFCFDSKIFINLMMVYSLLCEAKGQAAEALEIAIKGGISTNFPNLDNSTIEACYLKHQLVERASQLTILNSINGVAAASSGGKGGGNKASATAEPLPINNNPFLSVYSNVAVAELEAFDQNNVNKVPKEMLTVALEKASNTLQNEVFAMISKEDEKVTAKVKEHVEHRLEMLLECYARISRLKIVLDNDYVVAQEIAEKGVHIFHQFANGNSINHITRRNNDGEDELKEEKYLLNVAEGQFTNSRIYRYVAVCEQNIALAVISFFQNASSGGSSTAVAALDPSLVGRLQFIALQHLQPSLVFAIKAFENDIIISTLELILLIERQLIHLSDYSSQAFRLGNVIIDLVINSYFSQRRSSIRQQHLSHVQKVIKDLFLILIVHLIHQTSYDHGLKLIQKAFDVVTDPQLQKELWPGKVVCMSKKGMNVLDGLQKLKDNSNPLLQAEVLALFARSTNDIKSKISTYQQVIEILSGGASGHAVSNTTIASTVKTTGGDQPKIFVAYIERIDYLIELAEVMNIYGFPRQEIKAILRETLMMLSEYEEMEFEEIKEWEEGDDEELRPEASSVSINNKRAPPRSTSSSQGGAIGKSLSGTASRKGLESKSASRFAGSQKAARSRAPSRSNRGSTRDTEEEEMKNRNRMRLKQFEQGFRLSMLLFTIELKTVDKQKYLFKSVYYIHRSICYIFQTLQDIFKRNAYQEAVKDGVTIEFEAFSPNYPDFLQTPFTLLDDPIQLLQLVEQSHLRAMIIKEQAEQRFDLPSFDSFPAFSATIYQLFQAIEELKRSHFYDFALIGLAYVKLLLLTVPLPPSTSSMSSSRRNDRLPALVATQLLTYQVLYYQGRKAETIQSIMEESSIIFITSEGAELKMNIGTAILQYIDEQRQLYSQQGIIPTHFLDMSFQDVMKVSSTQEGNENELTSLKMNPFQLDTSNLQFSSLTTLEEVYYWVKVIPVLIKLGQYNVAEHLIFVLLFECREKKQWKLFLETSNYYLQILSLQGKQTDIVAFTYSERFLLQRIGDIQLFQLSFQNLLTVFNSLQNYDEMKILFQLLFQLLSDLSIRKIVKQKPIPETGMTQSSLFQGASTNALASKIGTQSALDLNKPPASTSIASTLNRPSSESKNEYTIMEIGSEYLQCLHQSFIFYLAFLRQYYESRIQNSLNPSIMLLFANSEKWEVDDAFEEFFKCHLSIQDMFNQYLGENHQYVKEINYQRGINAFGYLKSVHLYYSKSTSTSSHDAIYNNWLIEKVKRCIDLVSAAVDLQKLEIERYEPLFNFLPPIPSVSNNSFNEVAVSFDFSAPPTSFPQHPAGVASSKIQPLLYIELGEMQLEYAKILFFLAMLYRQYLPSSPLVDPNATVAATEEDNVIAQYLKETEETSLISLQETFFNDYIRQVTFVTSTALTNLSGTSQQFQAKLLFLISQVANSLYQQQGSSLNSIQSYRDQLQGLMKEQIDKADTENDSLMDLFAIGCQLLIESYHQEGNANKSAYWTFYAQSLFAKVSLKKLWRKSLMNSTAQQQNELMSCLRRISLFESFKYPNPSEFKSYEVDSAFLKSLPLPALKRYKALFLSLLIFIISLLESRLLLILSKF